MNLSELYRGCRSYRRFTRRPVPESVLRACLENARTAGSSGNAQTLRYYCVRTPEAVAKTQPLLKWAAALPPEIGTPKEGEQPAAFIVIVRKADSTPYVDFDVGIAADKIVTTAWESGVGSCVIAYVNRERIAALLGVEAGDTVALVVALGYPAHKSTIVPVPESGSIKYYVDDKRDYYVPKRAFDDVVRFV